MVIGSKNERLLRDTMGSSGKTARMRRLVAPGTDKVLCIPMDHGVSNGPLPGLEDVTRMFDAMAQGGATCAIVHKGHFPTLANYSTKFGLMMHLSAGSDLNPDALDKVLVGDVEEALRYGADAVSVHVNVGSPTESNQVEDLGAIASQANEWGVPLLAMMYPRGAKVKNQFDVDVVKKVARMGAELGADIVKTPYTGSAESFREVVRGCPVPVVIAGGPMMENDEAVLRVVADAIEAGAKGFSMGRNVFQHRNPVGIIKALRAVTLGEADVDEALRHVAAAAPPKRGPVAARGATEPQAPGATGKIKATR